MTEMLPVGTIVTAVPAGSLAGTPGQQFMVQSKVENGKIVSFLVPVQQVTEVEETVPEGTVTMDMLEREHSPTEKPRKMPRKEKDVLTKIRRQWVMDNFRKGTSVTCQTVGLVHFSPGGRRKRNRITVRAC
ncbi:hypothetical protein RvY_05203-7 [Ramazzottius varieornatus]|uniref:Uncharacterized protein n=1 Tax=Ramazzottius varieornatus TaxID=947166 RepID=A0A1D1UUA4_RAMVA|nr:hypothetical protein RvY_05203-7 [Ramazzottius varieornatus]